MEPEGLLPHSQVPATCPYPEPAQSIPYPPSHPTEKYKGKIPKTMNFYTTGVCSHKFGARGGAVFKALGYNPKGGKFDSRWCYWNF
jgi:hypothetical protein